MSATASCDGSMPPHFVYAKKSGRHGTEVRCDCPVYSSTPKVCQHSLAAADDMGILSDYLTFVRKIKSIGLNLSTLISKELPKSAGQKGTSRRKGAPKGTRSQFLKKQILYHSIPVLMLRMYHYQNPHHHLHHSHLRLLLPHLTVTSAAIFVRQHRLYRAYLCHSSN